MRRTGHLELQQSIESRVALLEGFEIRRKVGFASSIAERLYPNYEAFCRQVNNPKASLLRELIDRLWEASLAENQLSSVEISRFKQSAYELAPDTEEYSSIYTTLALDAAWTVMNGFEILAGSSNRETLLSVCNSPFESIGSWIAQLTAPADGRPYVDMNKFEGWSYASPWYQEEIQKQRQDVNMLTVATEMELFGTIGNMREESLVLGIQPIRRGLI